MKLHHKKWLLWAAWILPIAVMLIPVVDYYIYISRIVNQAVTYEEDAIFSLTNLEDDTGDGELWEPGWVLHEAKYNQILQSHYFAKHLELTFPDFMRSYSDKLLQGKLKKLRPELDGMFYGNCLRKNEWCEICKDLPLMNLAAPE